MKKKIISYFVLGIGTIISFIGLKSIEKPLTIEKYFYIFLYGLIPIINLILVNIFLNNKKE